MLAKATVVPRAVLDLGLGVDVKKGALLVAAFSCRETQPCVHLGQLWKSWTQTHLGFSQAGAHSVAKRTRWFWHLVPAWRTLKLRRVPRSLGFLTCTCSVKVLPSYVSILPQGSMTLTKVGKGYTIIILNNSWLHPLPRTGVLRTVVCPDTQTYLLRPGNYCSTLISFSHALVGTGERSEETGKVYLLGQK